MARFNDFIVFNQFFGRVLMDFRSDHLNANELEEPPSFLYAMDLGDGSYFVEETSLACSPPLDASPWARGATVRVWIRASNFFFDFNQFLLGFFQINVETDVVSTVLVAERALWSGYFLFRGLFQTEKVVL